uniref:Uncharacterized protein n=1 Tax=Heliothis virescens TaxID=7102 RepID=A0A2A4JVG6_HELVI
MTDENALRGFSMLCWKDLPQCRVARGKEINRHVVGGALANKSFDELLKKCRTIEDSLKESSKTSSNTSQTKSQAQDECARDIVIVAAAAAVGQHHRRAESAESVARRFEE